MKFTPIDLQNLPRGQTFYYFSKMAPTGYSLTVNMDITNLKHSTEHNKIKFFPSYLWLVTKNLNNQIEFKMAEQNGLLGYFDELTPLYASFHDDDKTFSLMWTKYDNDFQTFYRSYLKNQQKFKENHGVLSQPQTPPPPNAYTVSCLPWISFTHFAVHNYDNKAYYFPSIEAGKFYNDGNKLVMPLSITCHHAATDGYNVKCFLEQLQYDMDNFEKLI